MPADVAIQLEQMVAALYMLAFLVFLKICMIELKDWAKSAFVQSR